MATDTGSLLTVGLRNRAVAATSVAGVALRAAQLLSTLVTLPILIDHLGLAGFGIWGPATSMVWFIGMLDLGIGSGLVVTLPRAISAGQIDEARDLIGAAMFVAVCAAIAILVASAIYFTATGRFTVSNPFVVAAVSLGLNIPLSLSARAWLSVHKGYVASFWELVQILLALALIVWGAFSGAGVTWLVAAVYAALLAANAASVAHFFGSHAELRPAFRLTIPALRKVFTMGALLFVVTSSSMATYAFDNLLALKWLGPLASAQMVIALKVCTTAAGFLGVISQAFWPAFVDAMSRGEKAWLRQTSKKAFLLLTGLSVLGSAMLVIFGESALRLWLHRDIHLGAVIFWSMAGWIILTSLPVIPELIAASGSRLKILAGIYVLVAAATLLAKVPLARTAGVSGILISTPLAALFIGFPLSLWLALASIRNLPQHSGSAPPAGFA